MAPLVWLIVAAAAFGGLVAMIYVAQRSLMYFPERLHTPPAMAGLREAQEVTLDTKDGERVIVWHVPPRGEKPVLLYFHGNGGALRNRVDRFRALIADGNGLVALSYRGYGAVRAIFQCWPRRGRHVRCAEYGPGVSRASFAGRAPRVKDGHTVFMI
jgi:uncharacterized protein